MKTNTFDHQRGLLVEARTALKLFTSYSMGSSSPARGESSIGWQKGDGLGARERVQIAKEALRQIEAHLSETETD